MMVELPKSIVRTIRKIAKLLYFYLSNPTNLFASEKLGITNDGLKHWCLRENLIERSILDSGVWEPLETNAVKKLLQSDFVAFDIGANIGYFTLLMSRLVGVNGQVHCFEPTAYAFNRLQRNIGINPSLPLHNLKLNNTGLSSRCETKKEALEARFSSRLLAHDEEELIEFTTLDDYFCSLELNRVDFIKIDVDGYDYEVVKGGTATLKRYKPPVLAEICDRVLQEREVDVTTYLEAYLECGYTTCEILEAGEVITLKQAIEDSRFQHGSWNVLLF
jgi:FkbM family methyltransferase